MSKLLINDSNKLLVGTNGKAYAVRNLDVLKGSTSPVDFTAAAGRILRLMRYGKCEQNGTPTPSAPVDIVCNNGALKVYRNLFDRNDPTTIINAYVGSSSVGGSANIVSSTNDRSFIIKTKPNTKYTIQKLGGEAPYNRFRVSQSSVFPQIGQKVTKLYENTATTSGLRTTTVTTGNNGNYIIVYGLNGNPGTELPTFLDKFVVCEGDTINAGQIYTDGTPEALTIGPQSVLVENLLQVGDYADEQDIISGKITRRCGVCIYDGSQTIGDVFLSNTGGKDNGAIIVYPLAIPTTENVTPQPLNTVAGQNTLTDTANVSNPEYNLIYKI